jgi:phosphate transport system protein
MVMKFHAELKDLKQDVLDMGGLAKEMLEKSVEALKNRDTKMARWVNSKKRKLSRMDVDIEEKSLRLIALYQPVAKDLRTIACSLKMITYLARIGRYGKDISNIAVELSSKPHLAKLVSIPYMSQIVCGMINNALKAYEKEDLSLIKGFSEKDDSVDALRYSIVRECVSYMIEDQRIITRCLNYAMVARYLERCADHACKLAEKVHYMVTGKHIEIK